MGQENKLLKGMVIGAIVGGAVSMFDRHTRETTVGNLKTCSKKAMTAMKDPAKTVNDITTKVTDFRIKFEKATDELSELFEKMNELSEVSKAKKLEDNG